ncbi:MAG: AMP-binding protein [Pseudomonadota bacterium]
MLLPRMESYDTAKQTYTRPTMPETFNYCDIIDGYAQDPTREALIWSNEQGQERILTFKEISEGSKRIASILKERGVSRGDTVLIMLPRIPEWQMAMLATFRIGAIALPCITMLTPSDLEYRINQADPKAIIALGSETEKFDGIVPEATAKLSVPYLSESNDETWLDLLEAMPRASTDVTTEAMRPDEGSILYFTSGSTGYPKGVLHSAFFARAFLEVSAYWFDLNEQQRDDTMWGTADTGWSFSATSTLIGPWLAGVRAVTYDGRFDARKRLELIAKYGVTHYAASASEFRWLLAEDVEAFDLSRLRLTVTSGEALDAPTATGWMKRSGCRIHEAYGQTEALMLIANYPVTEIRPGAMGLPFPGMAVDVIDEETFMPAKPGAVGHVAVKMPFEGMMLGYWKADEKTNDCFRTNAAGEKWYITGDLARRDADGYFWYEGRSDDVINTAGYRIGPAEVEGAVMAHCAVKECAAVPSPDKDRGVVVKAFIVLHDGYNGSPELQTEIQQFVKSTTAPYKYPRKIEFVAELPKTITGKVRRKDLRDMEANSEAEMIA